jgi:hypothetical protein
MENKSMAFKLNAKPTNNTRAARSEDDEYAGLWINVGVVTEDEESGETKFNRLPRGIAISDLQDHRVYASSNPDWAAEATLVNSVMSMIREAGMSLEEGEAKPINLSVQIYRRQEQVEQVAPASVDADLQEKLFA